MPVCGIPAGARRHEGGPRAFADRRPRPSTRFRRVAAATAGSPAEIEALAVAGEPVLLDGLVDHWPAVAAGRRSPAALNAYLKALDQGAPVPVMEAPAASGGRFGYGPDLREFSFTKRQRPLGETLDRIERGVGHGRGAGHRHPDAAAGGAPARLPPPTIRCRCCRRAPSRGCGWAGRSGRRSTTIRDHNLACVIAGRRRFLLFPPEQVAEPLYRSARPAAAAFAGRSGRARSRAFPALRAKPWRRRRSPSSDPAMRCCCRNIGGTTSPRATPITRWSITGGEAAPRGLENARRLLPRRLARDPEPADRASGFTGGRCSKPMSSTRPGREPPTSRRALRAYLGDMAPRERARAEAPAGAGDPEASRIQSPPRYRSPYASALSFWLRLAAAGIAIATASPGTAAARAADPASIAARADGLEARRGALRMRVTALTELDPARPDRARRRLAGGCELGGRRGPPRPIGRESRAPATASPRRRFASISGRTCGWR